VITGVVSGGWLGLLIGLIFWIVSPWGPGAVIVAILLGLVFGAVWAAIAQVVHQRAFASAPAIVADHYEVRVDAELGGCPYGIRQVAWGGHGVCWPTVGVGLEG
jgi:hypothetical protein